MALAEHALPFGLRDIKVFPLDAEGETPTTGADLPAARTLSFAETEDFEELRGDDTVIASHGNGPTVDWELEGGGIDLDVYAIIAGGAVSSSGVTPNIVKTYAKAGGDARPYFRVKGQAISDSGGEVHVVIYKCKAEGDLGGEFADGTFYLMGAAGRGFPNDADELYDIIQHETATAISTTP